MRRNKSVYFTENNYNYVNEEAEKEKITFNRKVNEIIEKDKKQKDEV